MAWISEGLLSPGQLLVRKVRYVTLDGAVAIEQVRSELGYLEFGQLHRLALDRHLGKRESRSG